MSSVSPGEFRVNGYPIGTSSVDAHLETPPSSTRPHRVGEHSVRQGESTATWRGKELATLEATLHLHGPASSVAEEALFLADLLDVDDDELPPTLEASAPFRRDVDRAAFWVLDMPETPRTNSDDTLYTIPVTLLFLGAWTSDDGGFEHKITGTFEKTATGWERDDGETFTDSEGPLLRVPNQHHVDVPRFTRESDLVEVQLEPDSVDDGSDEGRVTRRYELYDLTGFLHPEPTQTGDVGRYHGWMAPTWHWLDGELPPGASLDTLGLDTMTATALRRRLGVTTLDTLGLDTMQASIGFYRASGSTTMVSLGHDTITAAGGLDEVRLLEDGTQRTTEDGTKRVLERQ